ncbi:MAG TPA: ATP-binding protein, partial [Symbiobacteriaceae bacterium]|nr:ATP-binding protein [Symbiobacteriaceae bacterium]
RAYLVTSGAPLDDQIRALVAGLNQIERYIRLFLNNLQAGVMLVDASGRVAVCSQPMVRLTGVEASAIVGRPWAEVLGGLGIHTEPLDGESHRQVRAEITRPDGRHLGVELLVAAVTGGDHRVILMEDAAQARQDSDWFERAERLALAGELATAIAHEIRNPLTVVAGSVQLIPQRLDDEEFLLSLSQIAGQELGRVNRIIQGLLGFARYSEPQMELLDLSDVVDRAVEFIRWYAQKHGVQVILQQQPGCMRVYGDQEHLRQALLNLMMNGIQVMEGGGELLVSLEHPSGSRFVQVRIADQGPGIEPERLAKIWEVFYSSRPGGTGLGLPVVQRIVDEHRGQVEVESIPGKGACFTVLLPLTTRAD